MWYDDANYKSFLGFSCCIYTQFDPHDAALSLSKPQLSAGRPSVVGKAILLKCEKINVNIIKNWDSSLVYKCGLLSLLLVILEWIHKSSLYWAIRLYPIEIPFFFQKKKIHEIWFFKLLKWSLNTLISSISLSLVVWATCSISRKKTDFFFPCSGYSD